MAPALSVLALAVAACLMLVAQAVKLRNLTVLALDESRLKEATAKMAELEKTAGEVETLRRELAEVGELTQRLMTSSEVVAETRESIQKVQSSLDKSIQSIRAAGKGRKKKQVDAEVKRVETEAKRQLASLKEKQSKAAVELKQTSEALSRKLKASETGADRGAPKPDAGRRPAEASRSTKTAPKRATAPGARE